MAEPPRYHDPELPDYEIGHTEPAQVPASASRAPMLTRLVAVVLIVAAAAAAYVVFRGRPAARQAAAERPAASAQPHDEALPPLGGAPAPVTVPPLDESDAVVRELVRQLTTNPTVAAWLTTDGLIRNFTVVTSNIVDGASPGRQLRPLRPTEPFAVIRQGNRLVIDPASYHRYDRIAAAAGSIDPSGAARLYATLKPRIEQAYRELGHPDAPVDRLIEQAIVQLLRTPIVENAPEVVPGTRGIGYMFADPGLESLTAGQKHLVRMGPENTRAIQRSLRAIATALGIPASRLPRTATRRQNSTRVGRGRRRTASARGCGRQGP